MKVRTLFLAAAVVATASAALADGVVIKQTAEPVTRVYPGRNIDILGIKLGMSPDQVVEILGREYSSKPRIETSTVSIKYKGIEVETTPYIHQIHSSNNDGSDSIYIGFAYSSTGNGVVGIERSIIFNDVKRAPQMDTIFTQIHSKYGQASAPPLDHQELDTHSFGEYWLFKIAGIVECKKEKGEICPEAYTVIQGNSSAYSKAAADGYLLNIHSYIIQARVDPSRAQTLGIIIDDIENKVLSFKELIAQLNAAAEEEYRRQAVPSAAPKL